MLIPSSFVLAADTTPPVTQSSLNPAVADGANGWYKSPVAVTLAASDDSSGVAAIKWQIDAPAGAWQTQNFSGALNLASNPSFENATGSTITSWTFGGLASSTGTSDSVNAVLGTKSAKIVSVENGWSGFRNQMSYVPVHPFDNLTASVWLKTQNVVGTGAYFRIFALGPSGSAEIANSSKILGTNNFVRLSKTFTVSVSDAYGIYVDLGLWGTGSAWYDAVEIKNSITDTQIEQTFSAPGSHSLNYYSVDSVGNQELTKSLSFKIDATGPSNWRNFTSTPSGNDHTLTSQTQVSDSGSGISVNDSFFQYSVDGGSTWGYYSNLKNCNSNWNNNGWLPITNISPNTSGVGDVALTTPTVDYCNSSWNICKIARFKQGDMAGNQTTKDICINGAWINIITGDVGANNNISFRAKGSTYNADGIIISSGTVNNFDSSHGWLVQSYPTITLPSYSGFLAQFPTTTPLPQGKLPTVSGRYLVNSSYTISSTTIPSNFTSSQFSSVVFVNGNLNVNADLSTVSNSSILFIVSGDVLIDNNVQNLKALFLADGKLDTAYNGNNGKDLSINGLAVANYFLLGRNLSTQGNSKASEQFFYQPADLLNLASVFGTSSVSWRETSP